MKRLAILVLCALLILALFGAMITESAWQRSSSCPTLVKKEENCNHDPLPVPPNPPKPPPPTVA